MFNFEQIDEKIKMSYKHLSPVLVNKVVQSLPEVVKGFMQCYSGIYIAGGYIRSILNDDQPHDLDIFGKTPETVKSAAIAFDKWCASKSTACIKKETANTISFFLPTLKVQFVINEDFCYEDCTALLNETFDFTVCCAAIYLDHRDKFWYGRCVDQYLEDVLGKILRFNGGTVAKAGFTLQRFIKYVLMGFKPTRKTVETLVQLITSDFTQSGCLHGEFAEKLLKDIPQWGTAWAVDTYDKNEE